MDGTDGRTPVDAFMCLPLDADSATRGAAKQAADEKSHCIRLKKSVKMVSVSHEIDKNSSEDEIANVNVLRRHRTCRGQSLRPLN